MKNLKTILFAFILIMAVGCSKDDDANPINNDTHPNGIKKLTASPINVTASTYKFGDNSLKTVDFIDIEEINGTNYIILNASKQIAVSVDDDFTPNGESILFFLNDTDVYEGQNFTVNESGEAIILTGEVINAASDTKNLVITLQESQFGAGYSEYTVNGDKAFLSGTLGTYTFNQILEINVNQPNVKTIVLGVIDGSMNDDINVETGRLIREAGYATHLKSNSEIYSGGVDLFCSGKTRTREAGSKIGVHSWCCGTGGLPANELPTDSPDHNTQIQYFTEMLGEPNGRDFYFFTLNAANFDDIHLMTDVEITQYQLITN